jgi:hypothetical protein
MRPSSSRQPDARIGDANRRIDSGASLADVTNFFRTRVDAAKHYGQRLAWMYAPANADSACWQCQTDARGQLVRCDWRGYFSNTDSLKENAGLTGTSIGLSIILALFSGWIVVYPLRGKVTEKITFSTCHCLCPSCLKRIRTRRAMGTALEVIAKFLFLLGLIATPFVSLAYFWLAPRSERGAVLPYLLLSIGMLIAGFLLILPLRALRIPRGLRSVAGSPFELAGLQRTL